MTPHVDGECKLKDQENGLRTEYYVHGIREHLAGCEHEFCLFLQITVNYPLSWVVAWKESRRCLFQAKKVENAMWACAIRLFSGAENIGGSSLPS